MRLASYACVHGSDLRNALFLGALLAALACAGPAGPPGPPGPSGSSGDAGIPGTQGAIDYNVMTPQELQDSKMAAVVTGFTIPADGRPVVNLAVTERHGSGVKGMSPSVVSWRFALLKLDPAGQGTAAGYANDSWVSYMAANDHSSASTETASTTGLTDNGDGTYVYRFTRVVTAGPTGAGTTYEPAKTHRLIVLLSASGNPFTPINIVKDSVPSTGADVTGQNDKVDPAACLECHTTFRAIAGGTGELGGGEFHGGARFDVHTCSACHNNQRRFAVTVTGPDSPAVASNLSWTGTMAVMNNEAVMNFPVFIHRIHMGERLTMTGLQNPPVPNDPGGTYVGYPTPWQVTFPQDVRNCVKCHRSPAPMADNYKNLPSRRTCGACHDNISFVTPVPNGRTLHSGGAQSSDNCTLCHSAGGPAGDIPGSHIPVSPPNPGNIYLNPAGNSNTNAASVAAAGVVPPGAHKINYLVKSVGTWDDAGTTRPQITFKIQLDGADVVFPPPPPPAGTGTAVELIPGFVGSPSAYFAFAVPQDNISAPADFNATGNAYIRNVWNGTGVCSSGTITATTTTTGAGILTGPDAGGFYTIQLKCVIIPSNAVMLTGGIGYNYSLGRLRSPSDPTLNFIDNNLPFTEIDLPAYPYTPNDPNGPPSSRLGGKGGLIVPALDVSMPANPASARRSIVATAKCAACHVSLGVGPDFHAGQRNDAATCNFCHTANQTASGWSGNQKNFVHSIHGSEKRLQKFTWHEVSPTAGYWEVTYPAVLNRCTMCHLDGTFDFSSDAAMAALPNMLPATVGVNTYSGTQNSPYVDSTGATNYGAGFSFSAATGNATQAAASTLIVTPIASACSACHDTPAAIDHMQTNGAGVWDSRSATASKQQGEQCLICHGPNRVAAISLVHADKTP
jgi:OmcA/MtrC family decaheme c-type cytochrome